MLLDRDQTTDLVGENGCHPTQVGNWSFDRPSGAFHFE